ncbi:MAG TPA: type ISP restriction/modification enzyme [Methylomirabilota bacterium]|nr:type ISP restriction/modification enzyme [Methylomirabilota bacterium]
MPIAFGSYIAEIQKNLARGDATEHTHRLALQALLQSVGKGITATNEPKHIPIIGAPDFKVSRGKIPLGHVETKDVGIDLAEMEHGKGSSGGQFIRYSNLPNWILTDYLEFHWFTLGERRRVVRIAEMVGKNKIKLLPNGEKELADLLESFIRCPALTVGTAEQLADSMAGYARTMQQQTIVAIQQEADGGWLHQWLRAFQGTLIPDLDEKKFSDMFAQTLVYGLFAARVHTPEKEDFTRNSAAHAIPKTNPFLQELFYEITGPKLPDAIAWVMEDIVELLNHADMPAVLKDFGKGQGKSDPVVHFYETFLAAYDPKLREVRGVYYTPEPVVSYIVRSVDHLLKTRFNRAKGLADENTLILDPATGTATFLYFVIEQIHQKFVKQKGAWDGYVEKNLLNRVFGFELLIAPYAIAHLKLGMQLADLGYKFGSDQRLGIYLTNTLEEAAKKTEQLFATWVAEEANAASEIKRDKKIMVVLGNPPYSISSQNRGEWIQNLIEDYKRDLSEKKLNLDDDFIKFIRFSQWRLEQTGHGVLGFITNNIYLDGLSHRRMRESLMKTFDEIYVFNLHGSVKDKHPRPDGSADENVFDIEQGVSIGLFVKLPKKQKCRVFHSELYGSRLEKYKFLSEADIAATDWNELNPTKENYFFVPKDFSNEAEYSKFYFFKDIFLVFGPGMKTERDALTIHWMPEDIKNVVSAFRNLPADELRSKFKLPEDSRDWTIAKAKADVVQNAASGKIIKIQYRPFDFRWTWYSGQSRGFIGTPGSRVTRNFLARQNLGLITNRQIVGDGFSHILASATPISHGTFYLGNRGQDYLCPLYLYDDPEAENKKHGGGTMLMALFESSPGYSVRRANLDPKFIADLTQRLGLKWLPVDSGDLKKTVGPEDVFNYAYAVFHSPTYRRRYAEFLKIDFPRLPLTNDLKLFRILAAKGAELVALHLMESPKLDKFITEFNVKGSNEIEKVQHTDNDQRVWINPKQFFAGVPKAVWEFHVGGYQVCEKWLKDRKERKLSYADIQHYQKIIVSLSETIRLMSEIDAAIPAWPLT